MKLFVFACLVAAVVAAPPAVSSSGNAEIVRYDSENIGTGPFSYSVEQTDGTKFNANGELKSGGGKDEEAFVVFKGSYEWVGPDGVAYNIVYTADENGYHPQITQGAGGVVPNEVIKSLIGQ